MGTRGETPLTKINTPAAKTLDSQNSDNSRISEESKTPAKELIKNLCSQFKNGAKEAVKGLSSGMEKAADLLSGPKLSPEIRNSRLFYKYALLLLLASSAVRCGGDESPFNNISKVKDFSGPNGPMPYAEMLKYFGTSSDFDFDDFDTAGKSPSVNASDKIEGNPELVPLKDGTMRLYFMKRTPSTYYELYYSEYKNGNTVGSGIKVNPSINDIYNQGITGFAFHAPSGKAYLMRKGELFECEWDPDMNDFVVKRPIDIASVYDAKYTSISNIAATTTHLILSVFNPKTNSMDTVRLEIEDAPSWTKLTPADQINANTTFDDWVGAVLPDGFTYTIKRDSANNFECAFNPSAYCTSIDNLYFSTNGTSIETISSDGCIIVSVLSDEENPGYTNLKLFLSSNPACQGGDPDPSGTSADTSADSTTDTTDLSVTTAEATDGTDHYEYNHTIKITCDGERSYLPADENKTPQFFGGHCILEAPDDSTIEFDTPEDKFEIRERAFVPEEKFRQFGIILHEGSIIQSNITHIPLEEQAPNSFVHFQLFGYPGQLLIVVGTGIGADLIYHTAYLKIFGVVNVVATDEKGNFVGEPETIDCKEEECATSVEEPESTDTICGISAEKNIPPAVLAVALAFAAAIMRALKKRNPETPEEKFIKQSRPGIIDERKNPQWK